MNINNSTPFIARGVWLSYPVKIDLDTIFTEISFKGNLLYYYVAIGQNQTQVIAIYHNQIKLRISPINFFEINNVKPNKYKKIKYVNRSIIDAIKDINTITEDNFKIFTNYKSAIKPLDECTELDILHQCPDLPQIEPDNNISLEQ